MTGFYAEAFCSIALLNPSDPFHAVAIEATKALTHRMEDLFPLRAAAGGSTSNIR